MYLRWITPLALLLGLASCAGTGGHVEQQPGSVSLPSVLPAAAQDVQRQLEAELMRLVATAGPVESVTCPIVIPNSEFDEELGELVLRWEMPNVGDYDGNGEVNISDIGPIAAHFQQSSAMPDWEAAQSADGDSNGVVNAADLVPIARNFRIKLQYCWWALEGDLKGHGQWQEYARTDSRNSFSFEQELYTEPYSRSLAYSIPNGEQVSAWRAVMKGPYADNLPPPLMVSATKDEAQGVKITFRVPYLNDSIQESRYAAFIIRRSGSFEPIALLERDDPLIYQVNQPDDPDYPMGIRYEYRDPEAPSDQTVSYTIAAVDQDGQESTASLPVAGYTLQFSESAVLDYNWPEVYFAPSITKAPYQGLALVIQEMWETPVVRVAYNRSVPEDGPLLWHSTDAEINGVVDYSKLLDLRLVGGPFAPVMLMQEWTGAEYQLRVATGAPGGYYALWESIVPDTGAMQGATAVAMNDGVIYVAFATPKVLHSPSLLKLASCDIGHTQEAEAWQIVELGTAPLSHTMAMSLYFFEGLPHLVITASESGYGHYSMHYASAATATPDGFVDWNQHKVTDIEYWESNQKAALISGRPVMLSGDFDGVHAHIATVKRPMAEEDWAHYPLSESDYFPEYDLIEHEGQLCALIVAPTPILFKAETSFPTSADDWQQMAIISANANYGPVRLVSYGQRLGFTLTEGKEGESKLRFMLED